MHVKRRTLKSIWKQDGRMFHWLMQPSLPSCLVYKVPILQNTTLLLKSQWLVLLPSYGSYFRYAVKSLSSTFRKCQVLQRHAATLIITAFTMCYVHHIYCPVRVTLKKRLTEGAGFGSLELQAETDLFLF